MVDVTFKIKELTLEKDFGEFSIEPLESGYGYTLGHSLRRVLLTSLPGTAVTAVKIAGVKHKFTQLQGLKENIIDLLLNVKGLVIRIPESTNSVTLKLHAKGTKLVTGADIQVSENAEVVNKDHYLGSLSGDKAKLDIEFTVERGFGYSLAEDRTHKEIDLIQTDAAFSPITRVNYSVESTRVGTKTNLDRLLLKIWTNGEVNPREALDHAAKILVAYFTQIYSPAITENEEKLPLPSAVSEEVIKTTIDELDLPTRIYNSLRNGGIETIGQLLATPRKDLVVMRNMGSKSITVIEEKLREKGISLSI